MNDNQTDRQRLSEAVGKVVDRFVRKHPAIDVAQVCTALGVVAGTCVAVNVPPGNPDADIMLGNVLGFGFGEAVKAARRVRAS